MTRDNFIMALTNRWRNLRAWGRSLDNVEITISPREFARRAGTCWSTQQRIIIYQQREIVEMLRTALHEMAHAATVGNRHDAVWQGVYAGAIAEVTGVKIPSSCDGGYEVMDLAAADAVRRWWRGSVHEFSYNLLCKV